MSVKVLLQELNKIITNTKMDKNMEHSHKEELRKYWQEQWPIFQQVKKHGWQKYLASLDLAQGFKLKDRKLRCIDEGTVGGVHLAGAGILLDLLDKAAVKDFVAQAEVTGIYSHAGCGAAALYAKQTGLDVSQLDDYVRDWTKKLAEVCGVPYAGHIELSEMSRPADFHIARVAYYDATGHFDPSQVAGLPPGFVISRRYVTPAYAKQEAEIAVNIALGDHGFGELITPDEPFHFVAIGDKRSGIAAELLQNELKEISLTKPGLINIAGWEFTES